MTPSTDSPTIDGWTRKDLEIFEQGLAAKKASRRMLEHQIELGLWKTSDELGRRMASLAEYDECIASMEATCKLARQSLKI